VRGCAEWEKIAFFVIFCHIGGKGLFLHYLAHCEAITSIPRVSIYNLSFETSLRSILKYETVWKNSLLFLFLRPQNGPISELYMVLSTKYLNLFVILGSNDRL